MKLSAFIFTARLISVFGFFTLSKLCNHQRRGATVLLASANEKSSYTLVLVRHGESTWNDENRFTGWADVPLSDRGRNEAFACGEELAKGRYNIDVAYTSLLKRAIHTLWIILEATDFMWIPVKSSWRLNERHYGALQGLNKQETVERHGKDKVLIWRRSYDIPPPELDETSEHYPGNDPRYANVEKSLLPFTESLKTTEERFLVEWEQNIVQDIKSGKDVLIVAHGNTLRALVKHLDNISESEITSLNIPTGVPLVYELDANMRPIPQKEAMAPLQGRYLGLSNIRYIDSKVELKSSLSSLAQPAGDQEAIKQRIMGVANQTK